MIIKYFYSKHQKLIFLLCFFISMLTAAQTPSVVRSQSYSARGTGAAGRLNSLSFNIPAGNGNNQLLLVSVWIERSHAGSEANNDPFSNNWVVAADGASTESTTSFPIQVNGINTVETAQRGAPLSHRSGNPNVVYISGYRITKYLHSSQGLPSSGTATIQLSGINLPEHPNDEMIVHAVLLKDVSPSRVPSQLVVNGSFYTPNTSTTVSATSPTPPDGRDNSELLYFGQGINFQQEALSVSPSAWLPLQSTLVTNAGSYRDWQTSITSTNEDDGTYHGTFYRTGLSGNPSFTLSRLTTNLTVYFFGTITAVFPLAKPIIAGTVYRDNNGLTGGVNGGGAGGGTWNTANSLYVNAVRNGVVIATAAVTSSGTFSFPAGGAITEGDVVTFQLSTNQGTVNQAPPAKVLPAGWATVGESINGGASDGTPDGEFILTIGSVSSITFATNVFGVYLAPNCTATVSTTASTCGVPGTATVTNYNAANTYTFSPTGPTVGAGGVISNATPGVNYTLTVSGASCTTSSANFSIPAYAGVDTDGDGIADDCDLDDDNDGILDTDECPSVPNTAIVEWRNASTTFPATVLAAFSTHLTATNSTTGSGLTRSYVPVQNYQLIANVAATSEATAITNNEYVEYTVTVNKPLGINQIRYYATSNDDTQYTYTLRVSSNGFASNMPVHGATSYPANNTNTTITLPNTLYLSPGTTYTFRVYFYNVGGGTSANFGHDDFTLLGFAECDTDGDGIPNRLDLDSDGDTCFDAIEGGENVVASQLNANGSINIALAAPNNGVGSVAANFGVPNLVNTGGSADTGSPTAGTVGQLIGSSQDALVSSCVCYGDPTIVAGATYPVRHGITILGRAGKVSTGTLNTAADWPMNKNSAYTALEGKSKGFVVTRNANPETSITIPVVGMMVFDTDENAGAGCLKIYTGPGAGEGWKCFNTQGCP